VNVLTPTADYQILYRDIDYQEGLSLNAYLYSPPIFTKSGPLPLTEIADGYYYLEVDLSTEGTYIVKIENASEVYRVVNMAKETSIQNIEDLMKATTVFNKTNNKLSFYKDAARTQLLVEFLISDVVVETAKTKL